VCECLFSLGDYLSCKERLLGRHVNGIGSTCSTSRWKAFDDGDGGIPEKDCSEFSRGYYLVGCTRRFRIGVIRHKLVRGFAVISLGTWSLDLIMQGVRPRQYYIFFLPITELFCPTRFSLLIVITSELTRYVNGFSDYSALM
jgi:hypothetical protein